MLTEGDVIMPSEPQKRKRRGTRNKKRQKLNNALRPLTIGKLGKKRKR